MNCPPGKSMIFLQKIWQEKTELAARPDQVDEGGLADIGDPDDHEV